MSKKQVLDDDDVNATVGNGTHLCRAIMDKNMTTFKKLLKKGADITGLHCRVCPPPLITAVKNNQIEMVKILLEHGANPNVRHPGKGVTPLIAAIANQNNDIVKLLIDYDADPNVTNTKGELPLFHAIFKKNVPAVNMLLEAGSKLVNKSRYALHFAAQNGATKVCAALLNHGVDKNQLDSKGRTALSFAEAFEDPACELYLCDRTPAHCSGIEIITDLNTFLEEDLAKFDGRELDFAAVDEIDVLDYRLGKFGTLIDLRLARYQKKLAYIRNGYGLDEDPAVRKVETKFRETLETQSEQSRRAMATIDDTIYTNVAYRSLNKWREITERRHNLLDDVIRQTLMLSEDAIARVMKYEEYVSILEDIKEMHEERVSSLHTRLHNVDKFAPVQINREEEEEEEPDEELMRKLNEVRGRIEERKKKAMMQNILI